MRELFAMYAAYWQVKGKHLRSFRLQQFRFCPFGEIEGLYFFIRSNRWRQSTFDHIHLELVLFWRDDYEFIRIPPP